MKEKLYKKEISRPLFVVTILCGALAAFMIGCLAEIKIQTYLGYEYSTGIGDSMEKTFHDGTKYLQKVVTDDTLLKRGDVISFSTTFDNGRLESWLKRIIALPNETIRIEGNNVYINDILLEEPYAFYSERSEGTLTRTLENNEYFVMGDNRSNSTDSRWLGPIKRNKITKVVIKYIK